MKSIEKNYEIKFFENKKGKMLFLSNETLSLSLWEVSLLVVNLNKSNQNHYQGSFNHLSNIYWNEKKKELHKSFSSLVLKMIKNLLLFFLFRFETKATLLEIKIKKIILISRRVCQVDQQDK